MKCAMPVQIIRRVWVASPMQLSDRKSFKKLLDGAGKLTSECLWPPYRVLINSWLGVRDSYLPAHLESPVLQLHFKNSSDDSWSVEVR